MCLYINEFHRNNKRGFNLHRVATRHILVWKRLDYRNATYGISPYRGFTWYFGKLEKVSNMRVEDNTIHAGLHAFTENDNYSPTRFPAIIPAGSKIWFSGDWHAEIASNQMIVFKNMTELEKVYGKVTPPVSYKILSK